MTPADTTRARASPYVTCHRLRPYCCALAALASKTRTLFGRRLNEGATISINRRRSIPPESPEAKAAWAREKIKKLTDAERGVLRLVARNLTTQDIASQLKVSPKTVENQRSTICRKIGITGNNALLRFGLTFATLLADS